MLTIVDNEPQEDELKLTMVLDRWRFEEGTTGAMLTLTAKPARTSDVIRPFGYELGLSAPRSYVVAQLC